MGFRHHVLLNAMCSMRSDFVRVLPHRLELVMDECFCVDELLHAMTLAKFGFYGSLEIIQSVCVLLFQYAKRNIFKCESINRR